ncbi:hypothetical protein M8J75_003405 [Diaphorina citri]|nr:hypothetical protein M8J75_003405 [Diaphorina citri]
MSELTESVKKCVSVLKAAKNDTEKFAALFMATKLVKGSDCNTKNKKALFEAIGFPFLKKLLLSTNVPSDCPPAIYKSVAISILSAFCREEEIATHKDMLANVPVFLDIVEQTDAENDDNLIFISEAYECLQNIASFEPGQKTLYEIGAVSRMSEIYSTNSFQTDEALNILVSVVSKYGPASWEGNTKGFNMLLNKISLDFETDNSDRKFELCSILHSLLLSCPQKEINLTSTSDESWPLNIYKALNDILKSKIGKKQRDPALKLASVIVEVLSIEWTLLDEERPQQFFLLLIQLCTVEVRMQLEDRSFKEIMDNADLVTACFTFLEIAITYLATDSLDLEQKEKQQLYTALKGAFTAVINLLTKLSKDMEIIKNGSIPEKIFICAMVRVLAAWLAQETSAMRSAVYGVLPFVLQLCNETFYAYRSHYVQERVKLESNKADAPSTTDSDGDPLSKIDLLRFLLPALCHLTVEDQGRKIMLDTKEEEVLHEALAFHWSIVHYKRPPVPKAERLLKKPVPELPAKLVEDMKDSKTAIISICNIFMNITVLESKLVEESALFASLMKFIFNNLPELKNVPENLVLHGHLAVLGLLLLKQQSKRVKKNDFSICRYIQVTIRFLWEAYTVDESSGDALVVHLNYKMHWREVEELWFLGMQTMSAILALEPWISEFAIESGWAQGTVDMLRKAQVGTIPANTKLAFEDFLVHLVEANKDVKKLFNDHDILTVCRTHRFMELGKKMFKS